MSEPIAEPKKRRRKKRPPWRVRIARVGKGAGNALEVMRLGRLGPRHGAPYAVVHQERHYRLRHYGDGTATAGRPTVLLIPPLMLTAEIYDVAPEVSAVMRLEAAGIDTWVIDFGAPEREEGGMSRTLDDHVRAVADAIGRMREATGHDVHIAGYSQGGMFAYQAAAYLASKGIASVITFGSPVDIHRSLPNVSTDVAARLVKAARPFVDGSLKRIEGLPGVITSTGFKLLGIRKEIGQVVDFVRKLHDRQALVKRESRRRFLAGEGFVAWPGPALRKFVDEFIVHNRLMSGGFIIDGRTVTLADVTCPVLYFVGGRDEIARPAAVRAIGLAAPRSETFEVAVHAGHFGLVVGSTANTKTWPTVIEWLRWREGKGSRPSLLPSGEAPIVDDEELENEALVESVDVELFYDVIVEAIGSAWSKVGEAYVDAGESLDALRYQLPRLTKLRRMEEDTLVSCGLSLAEQARAIPERTFFLWKGRAFSYGEADRRVDAVVRGLLARHVEKGDRVGVLMEGRPSYLSIVTALNRLGAVAVLVSPRLDDATLTRALGLEPLRFVVADPEQAARARRVFGGDVLVLGGGGPDRPLPPGVVDMEAIDPRAVVLPEWYRPNPGRARDLAMILLTVGDRGEARAARITNQRWALSAFGAAAACTVTSADTVYCSMPLHHPAGLLVSVGGALVGGARLALATRFEASVFWSEVQNYGATIAFYAGEMCRELMNAPSTPLERASSLRLFAGSGLRADVWRRLSARTGVGVLEFYASTEGTLVLANAGGEKIGALGRPLPGSAELALVAYDFESGEIALDAGHARRVAVGEPGLLITKLDPRRPIATGASARVLRGVFADGDAWLMSSDLLRVDEDGDLWFVDRIADFIRTEKGAVPSRPIEDALYEMEEVALAVAYGARVPGKAGEVPVAAVVLRPGAELDRAVLARVLDSFRPESRPIAVRVVDSIAMTEGYRPLKAELRAAGVGAEESARV